MEEEKPRSFENIASGTAVVAPFLSGPSLGPIFFFDCDAHALISGPNRSRKRRQCWDNSYLVSRSYSLHPHMSSR